MKINRISPQGYCGGVEQAILKINDTLKDKSIPKPIYLLGSSIHNKTVIKELIEKGAILIEEKNKTRLELLDKMDYGTVVFSAHGVAPAVYEKALKKGLTIVDTTCPYVKIIQNQIKEYLKKQFTILYIGTKNHPECEAILSISPSIRLITSIDDIHLLEKDYPSLYVTNQTTLSLYDTKTIYEEIQRKYPNAILDNKICQATTVRQQAVLNQEKVDLCIVVGDKSSSNTQKLKKAGEYANINTILIENVEELKKYDFTSISSISITSGASTPKEMVDEIILCLNEKDY